VESLDASSFRWGDRIKSPRRFETETFQDCRCQAKQLLFAENFRERGAKNSIAAVWETHRTPNVEDQPRAPAGRADSLE
jgi:hypothetical protein